MGCDRPCRRRRSTRRYFNPRIPYGMRLTRRNSPNCSTYFNPRIPYGMRRASMHVPVHVLEFQSTHPVWDATTPPAVVCWMLTISIHASRMGCDIRLHGWRYLFDYFNPRIPYGMRQLFKLGCQPRFDFNPRIPYGMRRSRETGGMQSPKISIHASRMGCDAKRRYHSGWSGISIHASRMGCDPSSYCDCPSLSNFNPRIPYGMRHVAWRDARLLVMISIHASRMGCDP